MLSYGMRPRIGHLGTRLISLLLRPACEPMQPDHDHAHKYLVRLLAEILVDDYLAERPTLTPQPVELAALENSEHNLAA